MKKIKNLALAAMSALLLLGTAQTSTAQDVDLSKYPDWRPYDPALERPFKKLKKQAAAKSGSATQRPDHLNNALSMFFPPVFNQSGGSCGSAQAIGYIFTHDMNNMRNTDASLEENQYPSHFTWLFTNTGVAKTPMGVGNGIPNVTHYGGRTYSNSFGYQVPENYYFGWMQGYDNWFNAMHNRMVDFFYGTNFSDWYGAREDLKQWLWNHYGEEGYIEGGCAGFGVASGGTWDNIPSTAVNDELGVSGKKYVWRWGKTYDHGLTICGYDDRIEFDLDQNGIAGEEDKDEKGAWIICNSWGANWCNQGFIYCPYAHSYSMINSAGNHTLPWAIELYHYRHNYRPLRTIKILMDYDHRWELSLFGGMAQDTSKTKPEQSAGFVHFQQVDNKDWDNNGVSPECPMLGRWADGYHYEPMEFGYDLTDLGESFDKTKPVKYFLTIKTKAGGIGQGHLYKASILNYEYDKDNPVEIPFDIDTIDIQGGGDAITIAVTVPGEAINPPLNATLNKTTLSWNTPEATTLSRNKYYIYKGGELIDSVATSRNSYTVKDPDAVYSVAAGYKYNGRQLISEQSNNASTPSILDNTDNKVLALTQQGLCVPNVFPKKVYQATFEFMLKTSKLNSLSNKMGSEDGDFFITASASGQITAGWSTANSNDFATTTASQIKNGQWKHVAIVVDRNIITIYIDGMKKKSVTSSTFSGVPAMGDFIVGLTDGLMEGTIDELRIWKTVRSLSEIFGGKDEAIANPAVMNDLLVYLPMTTIEENGQLKVRDYASGMHATLIGGVGQEAFTIDNSILHGGKIAVAPSITAAQDSAFAGSPVQYTAIAPLSCTSWQWSAPGAQTETFTTQSPHIIYNTPGDHTITLTLTNADGSTSEVTKDIYVRPATKPVADFDIAEDTKEAGELFSFINRSTGANTTYTWAIRGAHTELVNTTNATAVYDAPGTYTVVLSATNPSGTSLKSKKVTVKAAAPTPGFSVSPSAILLGEQTYLVDNSRGKADNWFWILDNGKRVLGVNGQNSSYTPKHPGVYDISLTTSNDVGSKSLTQKRRLYVSNADAKNALSFAGDQAVTFICPLQTNSKTWTIEWWMNPQQYTGAGGFATANDFLHMGGEANGAYKIVINGSTMISPSNYVILNQWHHYAITYSLGTVRFFRDGEVFSEPESKLTYTIGKWNGMMTISDPLNPYKGLIDEVRIWSKALTASAVKANANAPITNPAETSGLALYYDFNDGQGNVTDHSAQKHDGIRTGFGPDGDAWPLATGVFTLDLEPADIKSLDVTDTYLKNYQRPFVYDENTIVNNYNTNRFYALGSPWQVIGSTTEGTTTTGAHVDKNYYSDLCLSTTYFGFASSINDHRVFQTVTLPAGKYHFEATPSSISGSVSNVNIVATLGDELSTNSTLNTSLAHANVANTTGIDFLLGQDTQISLGILYSMTSYSRCNFTKFTLYRQELDVVEADGETSIYDAIAAGKAQAVTPRDGGIVIASKEKQQFRIYTVDGKCVFNELVQGTHFIPMPAGIYVADGQKIVVK